MRRLVLPLLLVLSIGGCGWLGRHDETSKPDGFLLHGYVSVAGAATGVTGTPCQAPASVPDIVQGGEVRVADTDGHPIAATTLASGVLAQQPDGYRCNFAFELRDLSGGRAAYVVMVGDRPAVTFQTKPLREGSPAVIPVSPVTASSSPS
ncbi:hypothetical protein ABT297_28755 [Dactylosporangium sp. NPDC000555]|uniref:hypothetical protein n=1 Tax=Dactylosporangium sp. NPDC000555 TaxID=3154260 RepID=UPI00331C2875